ncbi:MAG: hypothetical protein WDO18_21280 [Acidobacteriota bacterium]
MGVAAALLVSACGPSSAPSAVDRVAFLDIDNLTGDESLDWIAGAVPVMASAELAGVGKILPARVSSSREAAAQRAGHSVQGYVDRRQGNLHFEFSIEDTATRRMRHLSLDGDPLTVAAALARDVDPGAHAFPTSNSAALEAWGKRDFARAVQLDPDFGLAWRDLVQAQMATQPEAAAQAAQAALGRPTLKSPFDRAQLAFLLANLRRDDAGSPAPVPNSPSWSPTTLRLPAV